MRFPLDHYYIGGVRVPLTHKTMRGGFGYHEIYPANAPAPYPGQEHDGVDYADPIGTPAYAVADGQVEWVSNSGGLGFWMNCDGFRILYWHLSRVDMVKGQTVHEGDVVGLTGNTGASSGPHLHIATYTYGPDAHSFDPLTLFESMSNARLVKVVRKDGSEELGFYLPAMSPDALKDKGLNFGVPIPTLPDGSVDWGNLKPGYIINQ